MSILGNENTGSSSSFHVFKKQASFFFKEKIKTARLALTDVTPAQLLTEEATNGNPWAPNTRTLNIISKAAFEVDDYWRIIEILHNRLVKFDKKKWRESYNGVILLEHLLTHGPESVAQEFQSDKDVIKQMGNFQHIDEKGFNWGLNVRKKSEKVLKLLNEKSVLKEERERARKLSRGIQGFGSFSQRSFDGGILQESSMVKYRRSQSEYAEHDNIEEDGLSNEASIKPPPEKFQLQINENSNNKNLEKNSNYLMGKFDSEWSVKENMGPPKPKEDDDWNCSRESTSLLGDRENDVRPSASSAEYEEEEEDHPFGEKGLQTKVSLLSSTMNLTPEAC